VDPAGVAGLNLLCLQTPILSQLVISLIYSACRIYSESAAEFALRVEQSQISGT